MGDIFFQQFVFIFNGLPTTDGKGSTVNTGKRAAVLQTFIGGSGDHGPVKLAKQRKKKG